jgi:CheY-like chemotaxis protein/HPt (histidine-containing phosphotransfer) domain-containing protein
MNADEARAQGRLILVAEDDAMNQKLILRQLDLLGYVAEIAANGVHALRLWRDAHYALLLADLHMPEMDGYALTEAIRREEASRGGALRRLPILALTANSLRDEAIRALGVGMDEYLTKPLQLHLLRAALERWLPRGHSGTAPAAPPTERPDEVPVVDVAVLQSLVGNDPAIVREVLVEFLASVRRDAGDLCAAFAAGDVRQVGAIAHKLKAPAHTVGAMALGALCAELEDADRAKTDASLASAMPRFEAAVAAVQMKLAELIR